MKTLGSIAFIHNGIEFDYNFEQTIHNMQAFADQVVVLDAGSTDGTAEVCKRYEDYKTKVICLPLADWEAQTGKEKLAYFQNKAKEYLDTDYYLCMQMDEILHESSFRAVREAIQWGYEAFMCKRLNLWFDAYTILNVEQGRKPCSTEVIRLAKVKYDSVGDGESIDCPEVNFGLIDAIRIYHLGFVREMAVMKEKVIHMQEKVFVTPHDSRLDEDVQFNPDRYFNREKDSIPLFEPLPRHIQKWAEERWGKAPGGA